MAMMDMENIEILIRHSPKLLKKGYSFSFFIPALTQEKICYT
jgi:hypothetical protein